MGVRAVATGSYVPDSVITNDHIQQRFPECDPNWIVKHTGMRERRHAFPNQATSDLCHEAALRCLDQAKIDRGDIDLLIVATNSSDMTFPSTACLVQDRLKLKCAAVDLQAGCSGFMYALVTGASYVISGASNMALIIGGDCNSRIVDPNNMKVFPLFGDGAGAVLLTKGRPDQGLLGYTLGSDGGNGDMLSRPLCGSRLPPTPELVEQGMHYVHMDGRGVFSWAVGILCDTMKEVLDSCELRPSDIDLYVPHQANIRIINAAIDVLHIPRSKVYSNLDRYGNTSAGSIPLALDEAVTEGRVQPGNLILLAGFGAGLTWGTAVMRW